MISVDTIARVRRAHFVQGKSIKAIARELRLARNTSGIGRTPSGSILQARTLLLISWKSGLRPQ